MVQGEEVVDNALFLLLEEEGALCVEEVAVGICNYIIYKASVLVK